jgi:ribosomal protein S18 acetylase RimI-like enzyme
MTARVRLALTSDLEAIDRIERASFGSPWPLDAYAQELERRGGWLEVAELGALGVVGFSCTWHVPRSEPVHERRAGSARAAPDTSSRHGHSSALEAHLLRIAVDPSVRNAGVGRDLLGAVLARAVAASAEHMTLEVASENVAAIALYRAAGFVEIGRRAGYYRAPPDDAIIMRRDIQPANDILVGRTGNA